MDFMDLDVFLEKWIFLENGFGCFSGNNEFSGKFSDFQ